MATGARNPRREPFGNRPSPTPFAAGQSGALCGIIDPINL